MSPLEIAQAVKAKLESGFRYASDTEQYNRLEDWRSHTEAARAGRYWSDDCDGYALTAAQLAIEDYGAPQESVMLATCTTEAGVGHLVCLISDAKTSWLVDNRQRSVWRWDQVDYAWKLGMVLGTGTWRKINPPRA